MSSAANHARRSRRGFHLQKSITGGYSAKVWIKNAERKQTRERINVFRQFWKWITSQGNG